MQIASWVKSYQRGRMKLGRWTALLIYGVLIYYAGFYPFETFARAFKISTDSKAPTFYGYMKHGPGDHVVVNRLSYLFANPQRGDIVVFDCSEIPDLNRQEKTYYVFRVLGLPGERIEIKDGQIVVDGRALGQEDGVPRSQGNGHLPKLADSEYLVLGDNTENSFDNRYWGPVPRSAIIGKATRIYYPFSRLDSPLFPIRSST